MKYFSFRHWSTVHRLLLIRGKDEKQNTVLMSNTFSPSYVANCSHAVMWWASQTELQANKPTAPITTCHFIKNIPYVVEICIFTNLHLSNEKAVVVLNDFSTILAKNSFQNENELRSTCWKLSARNFYFSRFINEFSWMIFAYICLCASI